MAIFSESKARCIASDVATHTLHIQNVHYVQKNDVCKVKALTGRDVEVEERRTARFSLQNA